MELYYYHHFMNIDDYNQITIEENLLEFENDRKYIKQTKIVLKN